MESQVYLKSCLALYVFMTLQNEVMKKDRSIFLWYLWTLGASLSYKEWVSLYWVPRMGQLILGAALALQDVAIAAMGPIQGLPDYNWFRRRTYLLRY